MSLTPPAVTSHDLPTLFQRPDQVLDARGGRAPLYVIAPVFNSARYRTRWKLYEDFKDMVARAGAILYTVEVAFGDRAFAVTEAGNPQHLQLRTTSEAWWKEAATNLCVARLPADWQYVAMVDVDAHPVRSDWANETVHALQHYAVVQMWSEYHCVDSDYRMSSRNWSLMHAYFEKWPRGHRGGHPHHHSGSGEQGKHWAGSPGLAWAWRKSAWNQVGGMLDICIMGSADTYMANGLLQRLDDTIVSPHFSAGYRREIYQWQDRAAALKKNIGLVPGLWIHHWHGPMVNRGYSWRNKVLKENAYSPDVDLTRDWQGLYQLTDRSSELRDGVREYLRARNEDQL